MPMAIPTGNIKMAAMPNSNEKIFRIATSAPLDPAPPAEMKKRATNCTSAMLISTRNGLRNHKIALRVRLFFGLFLLMVVFNAYLRVLSKPLELFLEVLYAHQNANREQNQGAQTQHVRKDVEYGNHKLVFFSVTVSR